MKILFCDNSLKELLHFRGDVIKHILELGHEIVLVGPGNIDKGQFEGNINIIEVPMQRAGMNPFKDILLFYRLLKAYLKEAPDYIFHYTVKPNVYGSFAAKILKIPTSSMVTGLGYSFYHNDLRSSIARFLYRLSLNLNKNVIVLNEDNGKLLIERGIVKEEKIIVLKGGEGVNLHSYRPMK